VAFLAATSLIVPALRRARVSAVMGFLLIGVLLGPYGLAQLVPAAPWLAPYTLSNNDTTRLLAEFGVVFLLFIVGLEVSTERLWALRRYVFGLGVAQVLITASVIALIAYAFGNTPSVAVIAGLAFSLSSTAVVLQLLGERRQLSGPVGRAGFSILLLQDLAVVPILFLVAALAAGLAAEPGRLAIALGGAAAAIAGIYIVGKVILRPLLRWAAGIGSREVFVAAALLIVIGSASAAASLGLSMALGAFLAGLLLAETEFRHQIEADLDPFKGLLLGLFFVTVGMQIDPRLLLQQPLAVLGGLIGLYCIKAALLAPLARAFGLSWPRAFELALLLGQAGEFAFVILALARQHGVAPTASADYLMLVIALSIFVTPFVAQLGVALARRFERAGAAPALPDAASASGHVVIAGYGRVGQTLGAILAEQQVPHIALDGDSTLVAALRGKSWPVHFGDARRRDVLEAVGAGAADAIVVTMNDPEAVEHIVAEARRTWPRVPVYARARDAAQARRLQAAGAAKATPETVEAALQLGEALLGGIGVPDEAARSIIAAHRETEMARALSNEAGQT
jgi:CPA2 family monovalent cation:H+ antiporter-2